MQAVMELETVYIRPEYESVMPMNHWQVFDRESVSRVAIGQLIRPGYCFSPDMSTEAIYEEMKFDHSITDFTVVEDDTAIGFMTRTIMNEILGGKYGFTLHAKNPISDIMNTEFLRVNWDIPVDEVSRLAMQRPFERLYNPVVVEQEGKYLGIVTVQDLLDTCTKIALAERDEIALMRDSLKIGLFFMNREYTIQDQYSQYLENMLSETELFGKSFLNVLSASVSAKELDGIKDYFDMIFSGILDQSTIDDINPLNEIHYVSAATGCKKVFHCGFATIDRGNGEVFALVTIYDITAKIELQKQLMEAENRRQEEMKSLFEVIQVEPRVFDDFIDDAEYEFGKIDEILKNKKNSTHEILVEVYQSIHAIKSNAVVLGLNTFGNKAHELESIIKKLREQEEVPFDSMLNLTVGIENLAQEKDGFKATIEKIDSFKSNSTGKDRIKGQHILLESLSRAVNKASDDMGKKTKLLVYGIDDEALEKGPRRIIKEVLMQLIRNSVVHGIEPPEDRLAAGKNETGTIWYSIKMNEGNISIKLGDDGRGLDYNKIAEKALRLNLITEKDMQNKNALLKVIFSPGFSTAETEGLHAGRGIGLKLVKDRVREGNGSIKVQTEAGSGTVFNIIFPLTS